MSMNDDMKARIRTLCGYRPLGTMPHSAWRYYQAAGLLEFRMLNLTDAELDVVRRYFRQIALLDDAVADQDRARLLLEWRRRLCGFLGVPPGSDLAAAIKVVA